MVDFPPQTLKKRQKVAYHPLFLKNPFKNKTVTKDNHLTVNFKRCILHPPFSLLHIVLISSTCESLHGNMKTEMKRCASKIFKDYFLEVAHWPSYTKKISTPMTVKANHSILISNKRWNKTCQRHLPR